jgi:DNA-binding NarL/FixJ family response regulator
MQHYSLNNILVIDEIAPIALGLQEIFRSVLPDIRVEYVDNIFTAMSAPRFEEKTFDLIILGSWPEDPSRDLPPSIKELKGKFGNSKVMIYTTLYDHTLIEKMEMLDIDAYVHKFETVEEIRDIYLRLSDGERCISEILHTLYFKYKLDQQATRSKKED